jgi:nucleoredoxin
MAVFGLSGQTLKKLEGDWNEVSADSSLEGKKVVAFYFSAHWCPPCRAFTPLLKEAYEEYLEESSDIEIVFVSSDRSIEDMKEYMKTSHGNWLAIPNDSELGEALMAKFSIQGIPALIVCKSDGSVITNQGKADVQRAGPEGMKQWLKKI